MPITWTPENVARLFLITLMVHNVHMDYKQIAAVFGDEASPRAIEEKMKKLRKEFRELYSDVQTAPTNPRGGGREVKTEKGSKSASTKGRARPVKYEDGTIKWEYDNREDDSEEDDEINADGYGDLMAAYLMKKENATTTATMEITDLEDELPLLATRQPKLQPHLYEYHPIDVMFSHLTNNGSVISGHGHGYPMHLDTGEINPAMDPMLTQGISNMTFQHIPPSMHIDGPYHMQVANDGGAMTWEQNPDLQDLNNEFRGVEHTRMGYMQPLIDMNNIHMYVPPSRGQSSPAPGFVVHHGGESLGEGEEGDYNTNTDIGSGSGENQRIGGV
ncbi:hypothetical protein ABW19_dt0209598 [Dactylella cylindrospora]|nr:hypothetical protein ABW19_dt0209598 [Dactylella cylindrospora]